MVVSLAAEGGEWVAAVAEVTYDRWSCVAVGAMVLYADVVAVASETVLVCTAAATVLTYVPGD